MVDVSNLIQQRETLIQAVLHLERWAGFNPELRAPQQPAQRATDDKRRTSELPIAVIFAISFRSSFSCEPDPWTT